MTIRGTPDLRVITGQDFMMQSLNEPLTFGETVRQSGKEAFNKSFGLGALLREGRAKPLAYDPQLPQRQPDLIPDNMGPVEPAPWDNPKFDRPDWRLKSPEEVAAEGDTLFQDEAEMKASPYYRDGIKYEAGMTKLRLQVMSEEHDLSAIRNHYASLRPGAAILGSLAGAALEPTNYIPVLGEGATGAAVARVGPVLGRALTGAADAALNTAILSTLTARERSTWGDDTTWQTMASDIAFSAVAGSIFGGISGAFSDKSVAEAFRTEKNRQRATALLNEAIDSFISTGEIRVTQKELMSELISDLRDANMRTHATIGGKLVGEVRGYEVPLTMSPEFQRASGNARMRPSQGGKLIPTTQVSSYGNIEAVDKVRKLIDARTVTAKDLDKIDQDQVDGILQGTLRLAAEYVTGERPLPKTPTFLGWMRSEGGIKDTGGDVNSVLGGANKSLPGLVKANAERDLDAWGEKLQQEFPDVFPTRPSPNEVLTLIEDAARGEVKWFKEKAGNFTQEKIDAMKLATQLAELQGRVGQLDTKAKIAELFKSDEFQTFNDLAKREAEMGKSLPVRYDNANYHVPEDADVDPVYDFQYQEASKAAELSSKVPDDEVKALMDDAERNGIDTATWKSDIESQLDSMMNEGFYAPEEIERIKGEFAVEDENMEAVEAYNDAFDEIYQCASFRI